MGAPARAGRGDLVVRIDLNRGVVSCGRSACRTVGWWACRLVEVLENRSDRRCFGNEGNELRLGPAVRASEGPDLEQTGDEGGPQVTYRGSRQVIEAIGLVGLGCAWSVPGGLLG